MKDTGMVRKIDKLGRVVLPSEMRRTLEWEIGDSLEFYVDGNMMVLGKYEPYCVFCHTCGDLFKYQGKNVCVKCLAELKKR